MLSEFWLIILNTWMVEEVEAWSYYAKINLEERGYAAW